LLLAACGGDDDDGADDGGGGSRAAYVEELAASIRQHDEFPLDADQVECTAAAVVDLFGADALVDAGISPEELAGADDSASPNVDLPDDAADRLGTGLADAADRLGTGLADAADRLGTGLVDCDLVAPLEDVAINSVARTAGAEVPPEAATCLADNLDDRAVIAALARTFIDGSQDHFQQPLSAAIAACPSVMTTLMLADAPSGLSPEAEACVARFVEDNPDLMAQVVTPPPDTESQAREIDAAFTAACPEAAAALGYGG
jgi:hypothetical protein